MSLTKRLKKRKEENVVAEVEEEEIEVVNVAEIEPEAEKAVMNKNPILIIKGKGLVIKVIKANLRSLRRKRKEKASRKKQHKLYLNLKLSIRKLNLKDQLIGMHSVFERPNG